MTYETMLSPESYSLPSSPEDAKKAVAPLQTAEVDHPHIHTPEFKAWFGDWTRGEGSKVVHHERKTPHAMHGVSHGEIGRAHV